MTSLHLMLWISSYVSPSALMRLHSRLGLSRFFLYQEVPIRSCWQAITDNYHWQLDFQENRLCTFSQAALPFWQSIPLLFFSSFKTSFFKYISLSLSFLFPFLSPSSPPHKAWLCWDLLAHHAYQHCLINSLQSHLSAPILCYLLIVCF